MRHTRIIFFSISLLTLFLVNTFCFAQKNEQNIQKRIDSLKHISIPTTCLGPVLNCTRTELKEFVIPILVKLE